MREISALVTGAHGFIGRHLARALAARGRSVCGVGHGPWEAAERRAWGVAEWHEGDVSLRRLRECGVRPAVVFHCAGGASVARSLSETHLDFQRTVDSTAAVLEFARAAHGARVVLASSVAVYGSTDGVRAAEGREPRPASPYAEHKLLAEQLCAEAGRAHGVSTVVIRLPSVYGPGLRRQLLWDACSRLSRGETTFSGTGRETRDWLHVDDAVELLVAAAEHASPRCPVVNGGSGTPASVAEILSAVAAELGSGAPAFSGHARPGDPEHLVPDVSLARSWGWSPRHDWRSGVAGYCAWYRRGAP